MKAQSWSFVIFCYNEASCIGKVLGKLESTCEKMQLVDFEVITVDDGSSDDSHKIVEAYIEGKSKFTIHRHAKNLGIGMALRTGYEAAKYENVCALPADGQFDIEELIPFKKIDPSTIVSFYRADLSSYSVSRKLLSKFNKMLNFLIVGKPIKDVNWVKVYKNSDLKSIDWKLTSSLIESEIFSKLLLKGVKLMEVESKYQNRISGKSKAATFKVIFHAFKDMLSLYYVIFKFKHNGIIK